MFSTPSRQPPLMGPQETSLSFLPEPTCQTPLLTSVPPPLSHHRPQDNAVHSLRLQLNPGEEDDDNDNGRTSSSRSSADSSPPLTPLDSFSAATLSGFKSSVELHQPSPIVLSRKCLSVEQQLERVTVINFSDDSDQEPESRPILSENLLPLWSPTDSRFKFRPQTYAPAVVELAPLSRQRCSASPSPSGPSNPPRSGAVTTSPYDTLDSLPAQSVTYRQLLPRLAQLAGCLFGSLLVITLALSTLPSLHLPTSLEVINAQITQLRDYSNSSPAHFAHLTVIVSLIYIWKQAFSVPGTFFLNVLLGAIYGTFLSTLFCCLLTALGSTCAYQLSKLSRPLIKKTIPKALALVESQVQRFKVKHPDPSPSGSADQYDSGELWTYLLIARLLPVVPYSGLNLASGVLKLPLGPFFWTLVLGSLPYNFITTQVGQVLSEPARSMSEEVQLQVLSGSHSTHLQRPYHRLMGLEPNVLLKLSALTVLMMLPMFFKGRIKQVVVGAVGGSRKMVGWARSLAVKLRPHEQSQSVVLLSQGQR